MTDRGLVDVEIVRHGDGSYHEGQVRTHADVRIRTNRGAEVWVDERDVVARKAAEPETGAKPLPYFPTV